MPTLLEWVNEECHSGIGYLWITKLKFAKYRRLHFQLLKYCQQTNIKLGSRVPVQFLTKNFLIMKIIDVSDSLLCCRLGGKKNLIPQLGNEPGTSRFSFECSTN